jgi:glycosyltransferase involved in cell wall biosynthesis
MPVKLLQLTTVPATLECLMRGQFAFMQERGFEVTVVCAPGEALDRVAKRDRVTAIAVPLVRHVAPWSDFLSLVRLWRLFRRVRPDIVQASTGKAGPLGMVAAALAGVPVRVYMVRGVLINRGAGLFRTFLKFIEWIACRCAHRVFAVSDSVAEMLTEDYLCPPEKLKVLAKGSSNGVDAEGLFNPSEVDGNARTLLKQQLGFRDDLVIGFIGRVVKSKGIEELAEAWQGIRNELSNVRLMIVGPLEGEDPVPPGIIESLTNDPRVVMIDQVAHEDMPRYYNLIDVIAFPTYTEGLPNVPLEAAAMEVPTVASLVTGCVNAIEDGATGILVPVKDAVALKHGLMTYLSDRDLRKEHGRAARSRVLRDFSPEGVWEALYEEYIDLLRKRRVGGLGP